VAACEAHEGREPILVTSRRLDERLRRGRRGGEEQDGEDDGARDGSRRAARAVEETEGRGAIEHDLKAREQRARRRPATCQGLASTR
jgi:hypothetical protein